jgi:polyvinyl alcohol dehydrogenase (cytochrome)
MSPPAPSTRTSVPRLIAAIACLALLAVAACSSDDADNGDDGNRTEAGQTTEEPSSTTTGTDRGTADGSTTDSGNAEWPRYGHDPANTGSNPLETAIAADTVGRLAEVWSLDGVTGVTSTPTVVDGVAYFGDWTGNVRAVDPATGDEVWTTAIGGSVIGSPPVTDDALFAASGVTLFRLDRATGEVEWDAKTNEHPFAMASAAPVVVDDLVILGVASGELTVPIEDYTFAGSISAYDTETGEEVWRVDTTTADDENGAGVGIWSTPAVDPERGLLFVGTGNTYEEPSAELANSLVAIDYRTGEIAWSTQFTTPDVFSAGNATGSDSDVGASPNLWTSEGRDLVGAGDKAGDFHALDRETGEVVWETTLTPGSVFGGVMAAAAFVDGQLIVASNVGNPENNAPTGVAKAYALDPATGEIRWEVELEGAVYAPVSAVTGVAFVGTTTNVMLALDTGTGAELWRHEVTNQVGRRAVHRRPAR